MAARPPRIESDKYDAHVVGWENRRGDYHTVYDSDGNKVGRNPTGRSLEMADRVVVEWKGEFYTVPGLTEDYELDDAIAELEDVYSDK